MLLADRLLLNRANPLRGNRQRAILAGGATGSCAIAAGLWIALLRAPQSFYVNTPMSGIGFALQAIAVAALFGPMLAVEAVSHERLTTTGVDPLSGYTSRSFEVDQLFLRGNIEQWVLFAAGVLALAGTLSTASAAPAVTLATLIWIGGRLVFRVGYIFGSCYRGFGLCAHAQSLIILLFVTDRWAWAIEGLAGRLGAIGLFASAEMLLIARAVTAGKEERATLGAERRREPLPKL